MTLALGKSAQPKHSHPRLWALASLRPFARLCVVICLFAADTFAHPGWGLIVDRKGDIYFGDVETNTIWKLNRERRLEAITTGKHSHSLYLDEAGNLFGEHVYFDEAAAQWISSIWKLTPDGSLTDVVPPTSGPPKGSGVFMDRAGNVYSVQGGASVSDRAELLKRSPDGTVTVLAGGERGHADGKGAEAKFTYAIGMAWGPDGSLYVTDASCVRRVATDGTVTTIGGDPLAGVVRSENPRLLGLAADSHDNVFVADYDYHCVRQITPDGVVNALLNSGFLWSPSGVTVDGDDLYVFENQPESVVGILGALGIGPYARVRRLSADGRVTTIVSLWGRNTAVAVAGAFGLAALLVFGLRLRGRNRRASSEPR